MVFRQALQLNLPLDEVADCSIVLNLKQTDSVSLPTSHRQLSGSAVVSTPDRHRPFGGPMERTVLQGANRPGRAGGNRRCKRSGG